MAYRDYNAKTDLRAVRRIWKECGWIDSEEGDGALVETFFNFANDAIVATIDDEPECAVHSTHGTMRYQAETLKLGAVTAVTTSRIARKQGFAADLTARLIARQADAGMEISALGMFEQGFYNKVGFGTGAYDQWIRFDPATLLVDQAFRPPKRLTPDDYIAIHGALARRMPGHGHVNLAPPEFIKAELMWTESPFGLGYFDGPDGSLSHFIWGSAKGEHGPYEITMRAWENPSQLLELLALVRSIGDQVNQVSMLEIEGLQLQDLLRQPFRNRRATREGKFPAESRSFAYWQARILDLPACVAKTHLVTPALGFNLKLDDPVAAYLPEGENWRGIGGDYVVQLGADSSAERGHDPALPTLTASVNAFTRLWLGVRPASSLAITDELAGDAELLANLDETLRLPAPHLGLDF